MTSQMQHAHDHEHETHGHDEKSSPAMNKMEKQSDKIHWPMMAIAVILVAAVATMEKTAKSGRDASPKPTRMWLKE